MKLVCRADRLHDSTFSVIIILHIFIRFKYNIFGAIYSVGGQSEPLKWGEADGTIRLFGVSIHGDDLRRCVECLGKPA